MLFMLEGKEGVDGSDDEATTDAHPRERSGNYRATRDSAPIQQRWVVQSPQGAHSCATAQAVLAA